MTIDWIVQIREREGGRAADTRTSPQNARNCKISRRVVVVLGLVTDTVLAQQLLDISLALTQSRSVTTIKWLLLAGARFHPTALDYYD